MQDEVNEKTIALYIKTVKLTAQTLVKFSTWAVSAAALYCHTL